MVRSTDRPAMTIAVDLGHKATKKQQINRTARDWKEPHKISFSEPNVLSM